MNRFWAAGIGAIVVAAGVWRASAGALQQQGVPPLDSQRVQDQDSMTWGDYKPIPGRNWADPSLVPTRRQFKVALVAIDFDDQPFVITQPKQKELFGNPQIDPVPRERVAQFYADFWNTPSAVNHGHTINGYWMEQSRGRIGIGKIDAFGPYRMPKKLFQYGLNEWGQASFVPSGYVADGRMEEDADTLWLRDAGADIKSKYDFVLRIYAGYDETGVWQEFGEMKFADSTSIPPEWGNPDPTKPRWAATRYVPWTSWKAAAQQWGVASIRQGENSGTITHEIAHLMFRVGDNNNNPYVKPYRRVGTGPWDIMDRGSFNGPGGPHRRWVVPANEGAAMPAGLTLRSRMLHEFLAPGTLLQLNRNGLAQSGLAVGRVTARAVEPARGNLAGMYIVLDGDAPQDRTPPDDMNANPLSAGRPEYNYYTVEVVQRIGYDSFTPDNGVLITKNKYGRKETGSPGDDSQTGPGTFPPGAAPAGGRGGGGGGGRGAGPPCGSYNCFAWVIDAHPEDINKVDYRRPNGEVVMRTIADYRQLNDALFHAGPNSGSQYEWQDPHNRLHFYVIDLQRDAQGIMTYTLAVRSMDGSGPQRRGVAVQPGQRQNINNRMVCAFRVVNTGASAQTDAALHPDDARAYLNHDVYRLTAASTSGWGADLRNELAAIPFGGAREVQVWITRSANAPANGTITLTAVSESDPAKTANSTCSVRA